MTTHRTFCRFCHAICGIEVDVEDGRAVAVRGDRAHPISQGYLCEKGQALLEQHEAPERLRATQKRLPDGTFVPIPSAQAMDEIAARLAAIIARDGPQAIAVYIGTHGLFSAAKPLVIAWTRAIGTHWYFTPNTIDQPSISTAWARHGSWNAGVNRFADADVLLFAGNNPGVSAFSREGGPPYANAFKHLQDAKRRGVRIIAIDPRRTELARMADVHLQVTPGEDPTLLCGMVRVILEEDLYDREFVERHVTGLETLRAAVADFSPAYVEARAGVPAAADDRRRAPLRRGSARHGDDLHRRQHGAASGRHLPSRDGAQQPLRALQPRRRRRAESRASSYRRRVRYADVEPPRPLWGSGPRSRFRGLGQFMGEMPINVFADEVLTPGRRADQGAPLRRRQSGGRLPEPAEGRRRAPGARALRRPRREDDGDRRARALRGRLQALAREAGDVAHGRDPARRAVRPVHAGARRSRAFDVIEEWEFFWGLAHRMRTPLVLENGQAIDIDRKPTPDEYLDHTHAGVARPARRGAPPSRGAACSHRRRPSACSRGGPSAPTARMDVAPAAVVEPARRDSSRGVRAARRAPGSRIGSSAVA